MRGCSAYDVPRLAAHGTGVAWRVGCGDPPQGAARASLRRSVAPSLRRSVAPSLRRSVDLSGFDPSPYAQRPRNIEGRLGKFTSRRRRWSQRLAVAARVSFGGRFVALEVAL